MHLDTLYADLDAGRLYLTWRGHIPVNELDLTDVAGVLIAKEELRSEPLPREHYEKLLLDYLADPIGLELPPGFMMVAEAVEAAERAELKGEPLPDMKAIAENLPAGCPFPAWMLLAVGGDPDPLGIKAMIPKELMAAAEGDLTALGLPSQGDIDAGMAALDEIKSDAKPQDSLKKLSALEPMLPPDKRADFREQLGKLEKSLDDMDRKLADLPPEAQKPPAEPKPPKPMHEAMEEQKADLIKQLQAMKAQPPEAQPAGLDAAIKRVQDAPSIDAVATAALAPFAAIALPEIPDLPDADAIISGHREKIVAWEADLKEQGVDHPLMGLFGLGHRLLDRAPTWASVSSPDMTPLLEGLDMVAGKLTGMGVTAAALAPMLDFKGRLEALLAKLPPPKAKPPERDFAGQNLRGKDFSGQDLAGKCFVAANLVSVNFSKANLAGADFREAKLARANFEGANLEGALFDEALLSQARFDGANLRKARLKEVTCNEGSFVGADLSEASLELAQLVDSNLTGARMRGVNAVDAVFDKSLLRGADLTEARLESAKLIGAKLEKAILVDANLRFAVLTKAWLDEADLTRADLSIAQVNKMRAIGGIWREVRLDMTNCGSSLLNRLDLTGAKGDMTGFTKSDLSGATLHQVTFQKADFSDAILEEADLSHASMQQTSFRDTQASRARFVEADLQGSSAGGKPNFTEAVLVGLKGRSSVWMDADLTRADFSYADLREAQFQGAHGEAPRFFAAKLKDGNFRKARFRGAEFVQTDLCNVDLTHTELLQAQFVSANLYEAKFLFGQHAGCDFTRANLERAQFDEGRQP
ncbi:MAG: pentapeptide repeat-containing protein [Planctomycetota bacterium]